MNALPYTVMSNFSSCAYIIYPIPETRPTAYYVQVSTRYQS